jgi:hypothetical protein
MAFPQDIQSNTPAKYLFKLVSGSETVICNPEPLEWASGSLNIERDLDIGGVFISFVCDSLTFVGNGAEFLKNLFINSELNAKCELHIYWWKSSTRAYVEFPNSFDINFNFYETVKVGKFAFGVRVKAVNNSIQTKLENRKDIDVDITKLVSIGDFTITDYPALKKGLYYAATNVVNRCVVDKVTQSSQLYHTAGVLDYTCLPLDVITRGSFAELQAVGWGTRLALSAVPAFFKTALYDYTDIEVYYDIAVDVTDRYVGSYPWTLKLLETDAASNIINSYTIGGFGGIVKRYYFLGSETISITKGNSLKFVVETAGIDATYSAHMAWQSIILIQRIAEAPATSTEGFPVYEATERLLQHLLDVRYPFYSDFFGRTDTPYNASGSVYATENQLRFAHIQSGLNQRGLLLSDAENTLTLNFEDLFKSLKAIWNVGYSIEKITGESTYRLRIEEYAHYFQDVEVLDLSSRINKYDIQSAVMKELVPASLKSGFDSYEYLTVNGRAEPNTTNQRTSIMGTDTKFENISALRGDTKGILDNLANPLTDDDTEDKKGDSDNFIVKTQKSTPYQWIPETNENISVDNGSSIFGESLLNRYFTPSRMLIRHGNRIKSGMTRPDALVSVLKFQKTDKSSTLETTGETYTIKESDDIHVSTLADPIFKPIKHTVECLFTQTDLEILSANSLGYLTISDTVSGYLLSLKKKNNEDKAEITIIERYIP